MPIPEEVYERFKKWADGREKIFKFRYSKARGASDDVLDLLKPYRHVMAPENLQRWQNRAQRRSKAEKKARKNAQRPLERCS